MRKRLTPPGWLLPSGCAFTWHAPSAPSQLQPAVAARAARAAAGAARRGVRSSRCFARRGPGRNPGRRLAAPRNCAARAWRRSALPLWRAISQRTRRPCAFTCAVWAFHFLARRMRGICQSPMPGRCTRFSTCCAMQSRAAQIAGSTAAAGCRLCSAAICACCCTNSGAVGCAMLRRSIAKPLCAAAVRCPSPCCSAPPIPMKRSRWMQAAVPAQKPQTALPAGGAGAVFRRKLCAMRCSAPGGPVRSSKAGPGSSPSQRTGNLWRSSAMRWIGPRRRKSWPGISRSNSARWKRNSARTLRWTGRGWCCCSRSPPPNWAAIFWAARAAACRCWRLPRRAGWFSITCFCSA